MHRKTAAPEEQLLYSQNMFQIGKRGFRAENRLLTATEN
jgi:hypothetical protein